MTIVDGIKHGASSAYVRSKCRCDECKAWKSETDRAYRLANADTLRTSKRAYYYATIDVRRAYGANYRSNMDREAAAEYQRQWARKAYANGRPRSQETKDRRRERDAARRDEIRQTEADYRTMNAHKRRDWEAARRARIRCADIRRITARDWRRLCVRYGHRCAYCGCNGALTQDHIIPLIRGGRHAIGNLIPACGSCNSSKNDRLIVEWKSAKMAA